MEINAKAHHHSTTEPLLPISSNPSNPIVSQSIASQSFARLVHVQRILLLALGTFTLLCVFMLTPTQNPKIQLDSLFMSKLNVSNMSLGANWDMAFTVENPNMVSWVQFDRIEGSILYKDNPLAIYSVEPFDLGLKEQRLMRVKISTTGLQDQPKMKVSDLEEMNRQRKDGAVSLKMEMFAWATYKKGWWGTEDVMMEAHCLDLRVGFLPKVGFGSWISGGPMTCSTGSYAS
ncbi:hypothetical protein GBA52_023912 [Prunus armeniaca]|nr:hypothetical protein GBA52_023912 [Prunus armeniaca]